MPPTIAGSNQLERRAPQALTPEVVDPRIADIEAMARWFDYAFEIPGGFRFGLAGIIGLIPGIGDILDALISLYIVYRAVQIGVSRVTLARMVVNVGIESVIGALPFVGDLLVIGYKANKRNYQLLRSHLHEPLRQKSRDAWFLVITALILIACLSLPIIAIVLLLNRLFAL